MHTVDIDRAIAHYRERGWARLGKLCDERTLEDLRARADAIMLGDVVYDGLFFQHDSESGRYEDLEYGKGWEGPSLAYRKVEKLEKDQLFFEWIGNPIFKDVCARVYTRVAEDGVTLYRAFLMTKHAGGGSDLPWHQDGGTFWGLDRDPTLQIWTGLDDAPIGGGCVEVYEGSHLKGLATHLGGVVPDDKVAASDANETAVPIPTVAGEVLLLHNHVWHRSARSTVGKPRRALSACYMEGATQCRRKKRAPRTFVRVW